MLTGNLHPHEKNAAHVPPPKHLRDPARHAHRTALRAELSRVVLEAFRECSEQIRTLSDVVDSLMQAR